MKLSELLSKTSTGIGTLINDYRRNIADSKEPALPEGSPNLWQALGVLLKDREKQKEIEQYGGYTLDNPIELMYGTANRSNDFESIGKYRDFANERGLYASPENRNLPELEKQYSRDFAPQGEVKGLADQYDQRDLAGIGVQQSTGQSRYPRVYEFTHKIYPGSRITGDYYNALESGLDEDTLKRVIAISVAETGAGKAASSFKGDGSLKQNNFYGIHIAKDGKPANQYDPDLPTMIEDLKRNFGPGARYSTINRDTLSYYVQGKAYSKLTDAQKKSVDGELERYNWAYSKLN
jgi:alkylhydroperoxidase/carboxymuconolactone decarboxylase family protein YurZ